MATLKLTGLCGALRAESTNRKLMHEAVRLFGDCDFTEGSLHLPLYDGDLEAREGVPPAAKALAETVHEADAIVIACPEYNKGISGAMKNGLDWISRTGLPAWREKPVAIMAAAAGRAGGERSQFNLRLALMPFSPIIVPGPEVLVADSANQFDADGRLTNEINLKMLTTLMEMLRRYATEGSRPAA